MSEKCECCGQSKPTEARIIGSWPKRSTPEAQRAYEGVKEMVDEIRRTPDAPTAEDVDTMWREMHPDHERHG